jgi:branched-chain amino acid transport system substrate-binding protein
VTTAVAALVMAGCSIAVAGGAAAGAAAKSSSSPTSSLQCPPGLGTGAPGVTPTQINVAAVSTLTGPLSADFAALVPGAEAYFDTVDAHGGVDGRKIVLADNLNDVGTGSRFETETHTAIDQDHAFAVLVSSYWFIPTYFASTCTPTYGFNVTGDWTTSPNLYAAGGSVENYRSTAPSIAFLAKQLKVKSLATLAYGVSSSRDSCQTTMTSLHKAGFTVSYSDLQLTPLNPDLAPDVQRIRQSGAGLIVSCMTVDGNIALSRDLKLYGVKVKELWLTVINQTVLNKESSLIQGVYFRVENVPLDANRKFPGTYPGLAAYLSAMHRYAPAYTSDNTALQGWESAALLVAGIKAAGKDLTQANVVKMTNTLTAFTANGINTPMNWTRTHTYSTPPFCSAFVQVRGKVLEPVLGQGKQVFVCFGSTPKHSTPEPTIRGAPGPHVG